MSANELLLWMSANGEGTWSGFRTAVAEHVGDAGQDSSETKGLALYQKVRLGLQQLGHAEFSAGQTSRRWRVAPPVLAITGRNRPMAGVFCGARSPAQSEALKSSRLGIHIERFEGDTYPTVIRALSDDLRHLAQLTADLGLVLQADAAALMLAALPVVDDLRSWGSRVAELPFGRNTLVNRFETTRHSARWVDSSPEEAQKCSQGLFRFTRFQRREHFLKLNMQAFRVPGQLGNFVLASRLGRRVLRYDRYSRRLAVQDIYRPPLLVDRALILCSGFLPEHDPGHRSLVYTDVSASIAAAAAKVLGQEHIE